MPAAAEWPRDLAALVPVYNHVGQVGQVVRDLRGLGAPVFVLDDGSVDGSGEAAAAAGATVETLPFNRGKGAALRRGFARLRAAGYARALTCDADGQHPPSACRRLLAAPAGPHDIVVGCRDMAGAPRPNRFGRAFSNLWVRIACGVHPGDSQSGLRIYPLADVTALPVRAERYHFEVEILVRAAWAGIGLRRVPVAVLYPAERVSHYRPLVDNLLISLVFVRLVARRLLPWPHRRLVARRRPGLREILGQHLAPGPAAVGCALGAAMGVAPVPGFQMALAGYLAWRLRLNLPLVLLASNISFGPLLAAWAAGAMTIGGCLRLRTGPARALSELGRDLERIDWDAWSDVSGFVGLRFGEWVLGSLVLMPAVALIAGLLGWGLFAALSHIGRSDCVAGDRG